MVETCEHKFDVPDPAAYAERIDGDAESEGWILTPDEPGVEAADADADVEHVWTCPHPQLGDGVKTCVFHTQSAQQRSDVDVAQRFADRLDAASEHETPEQRRRHLQFIDATFTDFDLRGAVIGGDLREYIDFRHATIRNLDWRRAEVTQRVKFAQTTFELDEPYPSGDEYDFDDHPSVGFKQTDFRYDVDLRGATFDAPVRFHDAHFERWLGFKYSECTEPVDFQMAQFDGLMTIVGRTFDAKIRANATTFENYVEADGATFHGLVNFDTARFHDDVSAENAAFLDGARFVEATFDRSLRLTDATLEGTFRLSNLDVGRTLGARVADFDGELLITDGRVHHCRVAPTSGTGLVSVRDTTVDEGVFHQPTEGTVTYDFAFGTLGDVTLSTPDDTDPNGRCRFLRTTFDGFDFNDADDLELTDTTFEIYELSPDAREHLHGDDPDHDPSDLWATYLYAKNTATRVGDNAAAAEFFKREMRHRAAAHADRAKNADQFTDWFPARSRYVRNRLLGVLAGYGEEPFTVVLWSFVVILLFVVPFSVLLGVPTDLTTFGLYLAISFQSFVTFLLGSAPGGPSVPTQLVGAFEGLLGAFLIALFVFTLTRRIRR